jgi:chitinase
LDYDIEGAALGDIASIDIRNQALAMLKKKNPKIKISYTLPVLPTGLTALGLALLSSTVKNAVAVDRINLMTMDFVSLNFQVLKFIDFCRVRVLLQMVRQAWAGMP